MISCTTLTSLGALNMGFSHCLKDVYMSLSYEMLDVELRTARTVAPPWQLFASQPDKIASSQAPWRLTVRNKNTYQHCVAPHLILLTQFNPNYA